MRTMDVTITLKKQSSQSTWCQSPVLEFHLHATTHGDNCYESSFVRNSQFARPYWMHGQHQYQNVRYDGETCIRVPGLVETDAFRVKRLVPGTAEGMALPD
jgi:hypothetical protein